MSDQLVPGLLAVLVGLLLAFVLFVPYVVVQYRRRGELGPGRALLAFAVLVYALAVAAYVVLPLPQLTPDFCATQGVHHPQLRLLRFIDDIRNAGLPNAGLPNAVTPNDAAGTGLTAFLHNPAVTQLLLNVALFVPLGMFVRYLAGRGVLGTTAIGFAVSLLIETTQLTGDWFLYPCAYRLFDVDDLATNTLGALFGAFLAPLLRFVPGQRAPTLPPGAPRPLTAGRRLVGMVCDLLITYLLGGILHGLLELGLYAALGRRPTDVTDHALPYVVVGTWLPWLVLYLLVPLLGSGASLGQRAVLLRARTPTGERPAVARRILRALSGAGGYFLLVGLSDSLPDTSPLAGGALLLSWGLVLTSVVAVLSTRDRRGLSYAVTGLRISDVRSAPPPAGVGSGVESTPEPPGATEDPEHRREALPRVRNTEDP